MYNIFSYYQSSKIMTSMLTYREDKEYQVKIDLCQYEGLYGEMAPVKVITPVTYRNRTIILYPGASPYAEKHPKIEMLGIALAQNGYKVFIPRIPPLMRLNISEINVKWFICFYDWLLNKNTLNPSNIAMVGISFGGAIMLKAYLEFQNKLPIPKLIMTYGTYVDAESTLRFLLTGDILHNGIKYKITPNEWGLVVLFKNYLQNLDLTWDPTGIQKVMDLHIKEELNMRDSIIAKLPSNQKSIVQSILNGECNTRVKELCNAMIVNEKEALKNLSPKYWVHKIKQKVFIFHGANDSIVPFTESIQLAEHIPNAELLISYLYTHKEIVKDTSSYFLLKEVLRMIHFFSKFYYYNEN